MAQFQKRAIENEQPCDFLMAYRLFNRSLHRVASNSVGLSLNLRMYNNLRIDPWLEIDEQPAERVTQTISAKKSMFTVFFRPHWFRVIDNLPQNETLTAEHFIQCILVPVHQIYL
jgi:hypothetical protein